jgi:2,3-diketo-5-methylthio-1-phosphopentane phosphatase
MQLKVLCDFDGTITKVDTADAIFTRFAKPEWHAIESLWEAGEIGSAECMRRQMELVDASLSELDEALDEIEIDPTFPAFNSFCADHGIELLVVSDGVDYFIRRILQRAGLHGLPIRANRLIQRGKRRFSLGHPHRVTDCASGAGTCKCARAAAESFPYRTVLIGDGRSDFCVSHETDIVFAKKSLLRYTKEQGIAAFEYVTFADVQAAFETLLPVSAPLPIINASLGVSA